jgi:histidinol-phosphate aminotransferase
MEELVPENIRSLTPYPPGKPLSELKRELGIDRAIKLASNENSFGPSPKAVAAMRDALSELHRYPDGGAYYLRQRISQHVGAPPENLILGNGSNEVIELLIRTFCDREHGVLTSETTFVVYRLISTAAGVPFRSVPMKDLTFDTDAIAESYLSGEGGKPRLIFLCNPNNPTGTRFGQAELDRFLQKVGPEPILVLDEAYIEFVPEAERLDTARLLAERERTVVLRTFSKAYGIAGTRVGYGITSAAIADYTNRVRQPFNVNSLGQVGACAALDDAEYLDFVIKATEAGKQRVSARLEELGLRPVPSSTNFILFDCGRESWPLYEALLRKGVIVRPMKAYGLDNYLRVNVGTPEEDEWFLEAMAEVLSA